MNNQSPWVQDTCMYIFVFSLLNFLKLLNEQLVVFLVPHHISNLFAMAQVRYLLPHFLYTDYCKDICFKIFWLKKHILPPRRRDWPLFKFQPKIGKESPNFLESENLMNLKEKWSHLYRMCSCHFTSLSSDCLFLKNFTY